MPVEHSLNHEYTGISLGMCGFH